MLLQDCRVDGRQRASLVPLPKRDRGTARRGSPATAEGWGEAQDSCGRIPQGQGGHGIPSSDPILLCIRPTTGTLEQALGFRPVCQLQRRQQGPCRLALLQVGLLYRVENLLVQAQPAMTLVEMFVTLPWPFVSAGQAS